MLRIVDQAGITDRGRQRDANEDKLLVSPPFFAVADGMGGAKAGEVAAGMAMDAFAADGAAEGPAERRLEAIAREANRRIYELASSDESRRGMGTTLTAALVAGQEVSIGHVGDSRAYRLRDGRLEQLTHDHSLVGDLVRSGRLSPEEARSHPQRSVITRALGTDPDVDADTFTIEARPGDLFLLCSDGLTDKVNDGAILRTVERNRNDPERAARELVAEANRGGGDANITVVVFEIAEDGLEATAAMPAAAPDDEPSDEEEDTLSELDAIPTLEAPALADADTARRLPRPVVIALAVAAILVLALAALWFFVW